MTRRAAPLLAALTLLAAAAPAGARESGVSLDPDTPSAKEYAIPLEAARRDAAAPEEPGAPVDPGERSAPLFGEGITSPSPAPAKKRRGGAAARTTDTPRQPAERRSVRIATSRPGSPDGGLAVVVVIGGAGLGVVAAGAAAGAALRRRSR